ncbi:hypothetical protein [Brevibacterium sp. Mu109]|uniref:hypothetical protein n=1 Tax=Brevibacterium sp. Mu109 TaxID=1255669 RepID=UPI000C756B9D|nr:hypothetical protein [Brevibacterium sp. Mu109]
MIGGLVAAVTEPLDLAHGSWIAAYLVLVGGVAQCAMGYARTRRPCLTGWWGWGQVGAWNLGNVLVIAGTLASEPPVVDVGSALLVAALVIALQATRPATGRTATGSVTWIEWVHRILLLILAVSILVGILLSYLRHS